MKGTMNESRFSESQIIRILKGAVSDKIELSHPGKYKLKETFCHWNIADIDSPYLLRSIELHTTQQVGNTPCAADAALRAWSD
jgi:hypothetical protein